MWCIQKCCHPDTPAAHTCIYHVCCYLYIFWLCASLWAILSCRATIARSDRYIRCHRLLAVKPLSPMEHAGRRVGKGRTLGSASLLFSGGWTVTVGDRSFAAAGPRLWNSLAADVQSAPSLTTFRQKLKTHLFRQPYPDIVFNCFATVFLEVSFT